MTNNVVDDFFNDLITKIVSETMEDLFTDEFFPTMVDMFDIKETVTPIIMSAIDKKYQMQMEKVKDGKGEEKDGSKTTV